MNVYIFFPIWFCCDFEVSLYKFPQCRVFSQKNWMKLMPHEVACIFFREIDETSKPKMMYWYTWIKFNLKIIRKWDRKKLLVHFFSGVPSKKQITSPRATCPRTLQRLARRDSDVVDSCPFLWTQRTKGNTPWIDVIQQYTLSFLFEHGFQADGPNMSFHGFSWIFDMTFHNCIHLNPLDLIDGCFLSPGDRLLRHQLRPMPMPCALHGVQEASMTPDADGWALLVSLRWSCNHLEFRICMKL